MKTPNQPAEAADRTARLDRLSALLQRFELRARVLGSGPLQGVRRHQADADAGYLHVLRQGPVLLTDGQGRRVSIEPPSVVLLPRGPAHQLQAGPTDGADLVTARVAFGLGDENPLLRSLPDRLVVPLGDTPALDAVQTLLSAEAARQRCGHATVVDRLTEVLLVQLLRYAIEHRLVDVGLMAGLADTRLARALVALHDAPERAWSLDALAASAGMSRSRFAAHFVQVVGMPPGEYLLRWRVGLAKQLLRRGRPVKQVAEAVGYAGPSTFARAFSQVVKASPAAWARTQAR